MATLDEARSAKATLREKVAGLDGVIGVGVAPEFTDAVTVEQVAGTGESWVLQVNVTDPRLVDKVPEEIADVAVRVHVVGAVRAG